MRLVLITGKQEASLPEKIIDLLWSYLVQGSSSSKSDINVNIRLTKGLTILKNRYTLTDKLQL